MFVKFKKYLLNSFEKGTVINSYNLKALVFVGTFSHPLFALIHVHVFKMPWDSMGFKLIAGLICFLLITKDYWSQKYKFLFPFYWHFMLIYNLSFLITLTAVNNSMIKTWPMWELIMIYILIMYVPNWLIFLLDLCLGVICALLVHYYFYSDVIAIPVHQSLISDIAMYLSTFCFATFSGMVFSNSNAKGIESNERAKIFKALAGSIAHEIRNPLNIINFIALQINQLANSLDKNKNNEEKKSEGNIDAEELRVSLKNLSSRISDSIVNANNIINIILSDLGKKRIEATELSYIDPLKILPEIVKKYGYKNNKEKAKVQLIIPPEEVQKKSDDFIIKAFPERLTYIIFNLMKNALYYINQYPNSDVKIGLESRVIDKKKYNSIYVYDTGPGIKSEVMPKIFDDFFTSDKKGGTGLGLAFCKRNMLLFGGDIICESKFGGIDKFGNEISGWTKFSLIFPVISKDILINNDQENFENNMNSRNDNELGFEDFKKNKNEKSEEKVFNFKSTLGSKFLTKILIIGNQNNDIEIFKNKINKAFPHIFCEIISNQKEVIKKVREIQYQMIIIDIDGFGEGGVDIAKKIRLIKNKKPPRVLNFINFLKNFENEKFARIFQKSEIYQSVDDEENGSQINVNVPIVALTSLDRNSFLTSLKDLNNKAYFQNNSIFGTSKEFKPFSAYLDKNLSDNRFYREINKYLLNTQDNLDYLGKNEDYLKLLRNKKVLLADDQQINIIITKKILEDFGLIVSEANSGKELVEIYKNNLNSESSFDMIITDINMPPFNGDEASIEIRKIEYDFQIARLSNQGNKALEDKSPHLQSIPIIALTGDGNKESIHHFFDCGMDDYFIKGSDANLLLKIIANYLS
jgi:signal transduction histidine kinase/CheY-like chemotaxis protein